MSVDHQRVAGVVAALETRHRRGVLGQQIDQLALALIAPLGADDDDESAHQERTTNRINRPARMAEEAREAQLPLRHGGQLRHQSLGAERMHERHHALEDADDRQRSQQIIPIHPHHVLPERAHRSRCHLSDRWRCADI